MHPRDYLAAVSDARVTFHVTGPLGMRIDGTTSSLCLVEGPDALVVSVRLNTLETGIALRDQHVRDSLDTARFPEATLCLRKSDIGVPKEGEQLSATVPGTLTLHGMTQTVSAFYKARSQKTATVVDGWVHLNMNDFGISSPPHLGLSVKPGVDIEVSFLVTGSMSG